MFVDKVKIYVKAGNGGNGAVAFHREKYVAAGGPDGGDGGKGGNIVLRVNDNLSTLMDFRYKRKYAAAPGQDGQGGALLRQARRGPCHSGPARHGRARCRRRTRSSRICPTMRTLSSARAAAVAGGNEHFATPTRQVPRFAKAGLPGEEHSRSMLELKLLADVGLVGFPNVGKSTLVSTVSVQCHARRSPTTTSPRWYPNLGVVSCG